MKKPGARWQPNAKQRAMQNVRARARLAAKTGSTYQPSKTILLAISKVAYDAEQTATQARSVAKGAQQTAAVAKSEAADARSVANAAHSMAEENGERITGLEDQVRGCKEAMMQTQALVQQHTEQIEGGIVKSSQAQTLAMQAQTLAMHHEERLNADDRKRGYVTPVAQKPWQKK